MQKLLGLIEPGASKTILLAERLFLHKVRNLNAEGPAVLRVVEAEGVEETISIARNINKAEYNHLHLQGPVGAGGITKQVM